MATQAAPELLIVMGPGATPDQTEHVVARLAEVGVSARVSRGREATVIGAIGERELPASLPEAYPGVEQVLPIVKPYKLVSRELAADLTVIDVRGRKLGDSYFVHRGLAPSNTASRRSKRRASSRRPERRGCAAARSSPDVAVHVPGSVAPGSRSRRKARRPGCRW